LHSSTAFSRAEMYFMFISSLASRSSTFCLYSVMFWFSILIQFSSNCFEFSEFSL
jgi:hypothetical protein